MALWAQTQLERQLETAQQPCARVQKCHSSRLGSREWAPKLALGPVAPGCHDRKKAVRMGREGGSTTGDPGASSGRGNSARELVTQRDSWTGSRSRSSGQQRCRLEKDAVPVRADRAAYQAQTSGRGRPWEAAGSLSTLDPSRFVWRFTERPGADAWQESTQSCERQGTLRQKQNRQPLAPVLTYNDSRINLYRLCQILGNCHGK